MSKFRIFTAALAVPLAAGAVALAAGTAHASVGPVQYTPAGAGSISGYYAHALADAVNFTHIASYVGSDGSHTIEQLPVSTDTGAIAIKGAAGLGLCNQQNGDAAQIGLVNAGGGKMDVVAATGQIAVANNSDFCQGGIVNPAGSGAGLNSYFVLATGIPDNDTVVLNILYDYRDSYNGYTAGEVRFTADDLGHSGVTYEKDSAAFEASRPRLNEADAGAISDTQKEVPLSGTPPYPNPGCNGTFNCDPSLLEGFSHVGLSGNQVGGHEAHSGGELYASSAWNAFPVASSANGKTYLGPTVIVNDHFLELVGAPVSS
jgi:hypothetical protein